MSMLCPELLFTLTNNVFILFIRRSAAGSWK